MAQTLTYDEILDLAEAAHRRIDKKYSDDPSYIIRKRVANTATEVIRKVKDLAFSDLATDMYLICDEVGYKFFSSKYRNVIEFAKLHPEKLFDQLYKYLRDIAREIKKNNLLQDFFLFMSVLSEATRISTENREIFLAYLDLLSEQTEFLRTNMFNYNQLIVGITTEGDVLTVNDPFPNLDLPVYELSISRKKGKEAVAVMEKACRKYGYTYEDYEEIHATSGCYSNNINFLIPYINEFTYDMLPEKPYPPDSRIRLIEIKKPISYGEMLKARRRTLPANGLLVKFEDSIFFEKAFLKEVYYNNSIHLLCKFSTINGDITVRYNTANEAFFSPFDWIGGYADELHKTLKQIALWLYAAYVCPNEEQGILPTEEAYHLFTDDKKAELSFSSIGGKARTTLSKGSNKHLDYEKYEQKSVSIAGYIRKLPEGQKASEEKQLLAKALGLSLSDNETYVEPFVRQSWRLKIL